MNKRLVFIIFLILFILFFDVVQAKSLFSEKTNNLERLVNQNTDGDVRRLILDILHGEKNDIDIIKLISDRLFPDIKNNIKQIVSILIICILYTILKSVQNSFKNSTVAKASFMVFFLSIVSLTVKNMEDVLFYAVDIIHKATTFSEAILPIMLTTLVSMGYVSFAATLSPKMIFATVFSSEFLKNIILPIANVYIMISIIANMDDRLNLRRLQNVSKSIILWSVVLGLVIFTGIVSVEGFTSVSVDNVAAKSIKYTVGNFVPFVGKILSDAADTLASSLGLIKNITTVVGLLFFIFMVGVPLLKILALSLMFRITAALAEVISDARFSKFLED